MNSNGAYRSTQDFDIIWTRIVAHQGELFTTKTGLGFTYAIRGDGLMTSRTDYFLSKSDFRKAFAMVPMSGPGQINRLVRGPAYIWAILHDIRISQK